MLKLSASVFSLVGAGLLLIGCIYLSTGQFMPYHAEALQADWTELGPNYQGLFLGMLRGLGAGAATAGLAILVMAGASLRRDPQRFNVLLPLIAVGYTTLLCYATCTVQIRTPGNPPLLLSAFAVALSVLASVLYVASQRRRSTV